MDPQSQRRADRQRDTAETQISLSLDLDGSGKSTVDTGIPFFDHMLTLLSKHSLIDLEIKATGDIDVDYHHTVEDVGIVLGEAIKEALGNKSGIRRYGFFLLPMDETLARVVLDLSGRPFLEFNAPEAIALASIRDFPFQLVEEFMRGFANAVGANLHIDILRGRDAHHGAEAAFKGLARSIDQAVSIDPRVSGVPSTKDLL